MTLLPSLQPSSSQQNKNDHHQHHHFPLAPPSICITGVMFSEGTLIVHRQLDSGERLSGTLRYRIFRPRQLHMLPAPLIVLHGGPGVPSNYLMSLVNVVTDRAVIFYDQLGCGRSSRIAEKEAYSIDTMVDDLKSLISHWKVKKYHLFGHSFGGILIFEYLKVGEAEVCTACLSVILSSTPTETALVVEESKRLLSELNEEEANTDDSMKKRNALFLHTHECRATPLPLALQDAYAQASQVWRGVEAIPDYKAQASDQQICKSPPCLVLRGQYDFVTEKCVEGWKELLLLKNGKSQSMVLAGCSHHALLENEQLYGAVISSFLQENDL
jgi:proline-specific peptidase